MKDKMQMDTIFNFIGPGAIALLFLLFFAIVEGVRKQIKNKKFVDALFSDLSNISGFKFTSFGRHRPGHEERLRGCEPPHSTRSQCAARPSVRKFSAASNSSSWQC